VASHLLGDHIYVIRIPQPSKLICAAVNYLEFGQRDPAVLDAFLKSPSAVIGSGDTCELPPVPATVFHHEPELALVIGKTATKVSQDMAHPIRELISEFSKITTLEPGDVIATGVNHQQIGAVQDGDVLRMEIEGSGPALVIKVSDPLKREWPRGIDTEMAARVIASAPRRQAAPTVG